jgi:hypothetical protein
MITKETGMTKTKTKMPNLSRKASPPTQREWDEYTRQCLQYMQYQKEQIARKDAQIAALKRKVKRKVERMTKQFEKERLDFQDWLTRS